MVLGITYLRVIGIKESRERDKVSFLLYSVNHSCLVLYYSFVWFDGFNFQALL